LTLDVMIMLSQFSLLELDSSIFSMPNKLITLPWYRLYEWWAAFTSLHTYWLCHHDEVDTNAVQIFWNVFHSALLDTYEDNY